MKKKLWSIGRKLLIAVLIFTAAVLARETGYYAGLKEKLSGPVAEIGSTVGAASSASAETFSSVRPLAVMVCYPDSSKAASAYDGTVTEQAFLRFSAFLGEALGSAGEPEQIDEADFRSGMEVGCIFTDLGVSLPLDVLSGWLGTEMGGGAAAHSADILYLGLSGSEVVLCYREAGSGFFRCATAAQAETLNGRMNDFRGTDAAFAWEYARLEGAEDYMVVLDTMPEIHAVSSGSARSSADPDKLIDAVGMNSYVVSSYPEADGTMVYIDGEKNLRLSPDGTVTFHSGGTEIEAAGDLKSAVNCACCLAERSIDQYCGDADIRFAGVSCVTGTAEYTVYFDYCINGIPVCLPEGHAAEITVQGGSVTRLQLKLRQYALLESLEPVLPMMQAAAIAAAKESGTPELVYADSGDRASCVWVND